VQIQAKKNRQPITTNSPLNRTALLRFFWFNLNQFSDKREFRLINVQRFCQLAAKRLIMCGKVRAWTARDLSAFSLKFTKFFDNAMTEHNFLIKLIIFQFYFIGKKLSPSFYFITGSPPAVAGSSQVTI